MIPHQIAKFLLGVDLATASLTLSADTYPRQPGIEVRGYEFHLELHADNDVITGDAEIRVRTNQAGVAEVRLDLAGAKGGKGMAVSSVSRDGAAVAFIHRDRRLRLPLPAGVEAGAEFTFHVRYQGVPAAGFRIGPTRHGDRAFFSDSFPDKAREWLPVLDHPSSKAPCTFVVTAPAAFKVVANGRLAVEDALPGGRRRARWVEAVPIPAYLYAVAAAPFIVRAGASAEGVPLQSWTGKVEAATLGPALEEATKQSLAFLTPKLGPFPFEKLASVEAVEDYGGMENASAIFYAEKWLGGGRPLLGLVGHEVAHQWFGDLVTEADWDDVWLSEGFATYLGWCVEEQGLAPATVLERRAGTRRAVQRMEQKNPGVPVIHRNLADTGKVLNGFVYTKAGWVLHMLRRQVGDEAFWKALRAYLDRHARGTATTEDFRRAAEAASGQRLGWFFEQWLRRPGMPILEAAWRWDGASRLVRLELQQTQSGPTFQLPLEVQLVPPEGEPRSERIVLTGRKQSFTVPAEAMPLRISLDPECALLADVVAVKRSR